MANLVDRFPSTLTILPTYNCTAACENCCFGSHPGIAERIPLARILNYIEQAAALGTVKLIVFSGGECFTLGPELVIAVAKATELGLATRCVTNGYWATSEARAGDLLDPLHRAGLHEINISTGDFHQRYVAPTKVVTAAIAGVRAGMRVVIVVESRKGRRFTAERLISDQRIHEILGNSLFRIIESPWISMTRDENVEQAQAHMTSRLNLQAKRGCESVLSTIVVTPAEKLGACCGLTREQIPEMNVGSLRDHSMQELYQEASTDLLKMWLAVEGPERILAWASEKDPTIDWEHRYCHRCDACRALYHDPKVRDVIRAHYPEKQDDITLAFSLLDLPRSLSSLK
jgi:Radical SAM superfamily